jgi:hypothetical protein
MEAVCLDLEEVGEEGEVEEEDGLVEMSAVTTALKR